MSSILLFLWTNKFCLDSRFVSGPHCRHKTAVQTFRPCPCFSTFCQQKKIGQSKKFWIFASKKSFWICFEWNCLLSQMQLLQVLFKQLFEKQISKRYKADLMVRLNSITHTPNSQSSKIFFFCPDSCQGKETHPYGRNFHGKSEIFLLLPEK